MAQAVEFPTVRSFYRKHKWAIWVVGFFLAVIMVAGASGTPPQTPATNTADINQAFQAASGTPSTSTDLGVSSASFSQAAVTSTAATSSIVQSPEASSTHTAVEGGNPAPSEMPTTVTPTATDQTSQTSSQTLSSDNYYTNSNGTEVHSPAYTSNGEAPAGATAQCEDGTYSFSQHRSGTCSHHGGVAQWLQ